MPHKYGTTEDRAGAERVAAYGGGDVDTLLALGIIPVLVPDIDPRWKASRRRGTVVAREAPQGEKPVVASNDELQFEKVAAARPDLITAVEYDLKQPDYGKLSELAPTVPPPKGFAP